VRQLVDGVKKLGLAGPPSAPASPATSSPTEVSSLLGEGRELRVLIFIHPRARRTSPAPQGQRLAGANASATPWTTIALSHLIFEGTLDLPGLKDLLGPRRRLSAVYAPRSDNNRASRRHGHRHQAEAHGVSAADVHDTLVFTSRRSGTWRQSRVNRLVIGTDHRSLAGQVDRPRPQGPGFSDKERRAILGETAAGS
jgi:hypothetical protein